MMGIQLDTAPDRPPVTEDDVSQKSREELTKLFLHAEKIIKAREKGMWCSVGLPFCSTY